MSFDSMLTAPLRCTVLFGGLKLAYRGLQPANDIKDSI